MDTGGDLVPDYNYTQCSWKAATISVGRPLACVNFNYDASATADSESSYLVVYAGIEHGNLNTRNSKGDGVRRNGSEHNIPAFQYPILLYVYNPGMLGLLSEDLKPSGKHY
jgi:hypothetical protein